MENPKRVIDVEIGSYNESDAERITEHILDSKAHYKALEWLLTGQITPYQFMTDLASQAESLKKYFEENDNQDEEHLWEGA